MVDSFLDLNVDEGGHFLQDFAKEAFLELARRDPNVFCEYCFVDKGGEPWKQADFHREWHEFIPPPDDEQHFILIEAPRDHAKTTQISVARAIWELGRNPEIRIKIVTGEDELGVDILTEITQNLQHNDRLKEVFPNLIPDKDQGWTRHKIYVQRNVIQKDASIQVSPILSSKIGGRADFLIFDDVVNQRNAIFQPAFRNVVKETFRNAWGNVVTNESRVVYIFTPWHMDDLSHELKRDPAWKLWSQPAIVDGEPLWPEKWTLEKLERRREGFGDRAFQRQFMLIPLSAEETTFSQEVVDRCIRYDLTLDAQYPPEWPRYVGIDLASSLGKKASYSVIFTGVFDPKSGKRFPVEVVRRKVKFPELIKLIEIQGNKHHWDFGYVENNSFQDAVYAHLSDKGKGLALEGHYTGTKKWDEQIGLPGLAAEMGQGGWVLPKGCRGCDMVPCDCHKDGCDCVVCEWERELRFHPVYESADIVMAQWLCSQAIRKNMRSGPREFIDIGSIWKEYDRERASRN